MGPGPWPPFSTFNCRNPAGATLLKLFRKTGNLAGVVSNVLLLSGTGARSTTRLRAWSSFWPTCGSVLLFPSQNYNLVSLLYTGLQSVIDTVPAPLGDLPPPVF